MQLLRPVNVVTGNKVYMLKDLAFSSTASSTCVKSTLLKLWYFSWSALGPLH